MNILSKVNNAVNTNLT